MKRHPRLQYLYRPYQISQQANCFTVLPVRRSSAAHPSAHTGPQRCIGAHWPVTQWTRQNRAVHVELLGREHITCRLSQQVVAHLPCGLLTIKRFDPVELSRRRLVGSCYFTVPYLPKLQARAAGLEVGSLAVPRSCTHAISP
jgi:hypothetical protein